MRQRRLRNTPNPSQNLDSFLDILTNTVGVLMFIGLFVSLLAVETGTIIRTPLHKETNKVGHFFEVRNNEVFNLNDGRIYREIEKLLFTLPNCTRPDIPKDLDDYLYDYYLEEIKEYERCMEERYNKINNFSFDTDYYTVSLVDGGSLKYEPIAAVRGENKEQLLEDNSNFHHILQKLDPDVNFIGFIVRPDSFDAFRKARQEAWDRGFDVGWEPLAQDSILVFGSGGRSIGVQ